jgi:hypothetical protein
MANVTKKRNYPNNYFAWYNDDVRLAILELDTTPSTTGVTVERWDTFSSDGDLTGTISAVAISGTTATYTCTAAHNLIVGDWITISGTTNFNDDDLASTKVVAIDGLTFDMTLSAGGASPESGLSATFLSKFVNDGLRMTYHSKYEDVTAQTNNLKTDIGLDSGLHPALLLYIQAVLYENTGDLKSSQYYRALFEKKIKKYPLRKSGVRYLAVPRL